jgi:hypothetical protein
MIWLYERGPEVLRIETRFVQATSEFELIWHRPDGSVQSERFSTEATFRARLKAIESVLHSDEWHINGPPQILASGWRDGVTKPQMN